MGTRKAPEEHREALLQAAGRVFARRTYAGAKLEEIAREAGLTRGAISWHFSRKIALYRAYIEEVNSMAFTELLAIINGPGDPVTRLEAGTRYMVSTRVQKRLDTLILADLLNKPPQGAQDLKELVDGYFDRLIADHAAMMADGIAQGVFRPELDPDFMARSYYNYFWGFYLNLERFFGEHDDEALLQDRIHQLLVAPTLTS